MLAASCHVGYFCPTGPRAEKSLWNTAEQISVSTPKWMSLEDVTKMRALFSEEFFQRFHMAYRNYEDRFVPIASFCIVSSRFTGTWKMHTFSDLSTFCRLVNGWLQGICSLAAQAPAWFKWVEGSTLGSSPPAHIQTYIISRLFFRTRIIMQLEKESKLCIVSAFSVASNVFFKLWGFSLATISPAPTLEGGWCNPRRGSLSQFSDLTNMVLYNFVYGFVFVGSEETSLVWATWMKLMKPANRSNSKQ